MECDTAIALNRLVEARGTGWGQGFDYDGFGNLLAKRVTAGSAPVINLNYNAATNRISTGGYGYDNNGNLTSMPGSGWYGIGLSYDRDNRLWSVLDKVYGYAPDNKRVFKQVGTGPETYYLWAGNELLGTYQLTRNPEGDPEGIGMVSGTAWLARQKVGHAGGPGDIFGAVRQDRLGSNTGPYGTTKYYPYGEERSPNGQSEPGFFCAPIGDDF
jgi:YD repeat-containing protein